MNKPKLIYIASDVRSGSTILDLVLSRHPLIGSTGELCFLHQFYNEDYSFKSMQEAVCTCNLKVKDCSHWSEVSNILGQTHSIELADLDTMEKIPSGKFKKTFYNIFLFFTSLLPSSFISLLFRKNKKVIKNCWLILEILAKKKPSVEYIIDSSKGTERGKFYHLFSKGRVIKYIFLVRDSRGVVNSKKKWGLSTKRSAISWTLFNLKQLLFQFSLVKEKKIFIRYEDFCNNTEESLTQIFSFLDLKFDPQKFHIKNSNCHNIGGSPSRFKSKLTNITLDERWKVNLSYEDIKIINRYSGLLNRYFGYKQ